MAAGNLALRILLSSWLAALTSICLTSRPSTALISGSVASSQNSSTTLFENSIERALPLSEDSSRRLSGHAALAIYATPMKPS